MKGLARRYDLVILSLWAMAQIARCGPQPNKQPLVVPILKSAPQVDGDLGEEFWAESVATRKFGFASSAMIARVAAGPSALYVGFVCLGSAEQDRFEIRLRPFASFGPSETDAEDKKTQGKPDKATEPPQERLGPAVPPYDKLVRIEISATGDARVLARGGSDGERPHRVRAAVRRQPGGVTLEIAIPLSLVAPKGFWPRHGDLWLADLIRRGGAGTSAWAAQNKEAEALARDRAHLGEWVFGKANLLDNGGAEQWKLGAPKGWRLEAAGKRKAFASRDWDTVVEGRVACKVPYREKLTVWPGTRVGLRRGAMYRLSFVLWARPDPTTRVRIEISAAPNKTRDFIPPPEPVRVNMPFRAKADLAEPKITVQGKSGSVLIDGVRLEMVRP